MVPYQSNFLPGIWRWWFDFGCGDMGNDGVHDLDIARWGLGVQTHPSTVAALEESISLMMINSSRIRST
jgi:predicted dehydrogenase